MPYLKTERRLDLEEGQIADSELTPGDLNYLITLLCHRYFKEHHNYQGLNDIIGALESCKLELYRRKAGPYEDLKIFENGDV